jgi:hypothetical protein
MDNLDMLTLLQKKLMDNSMDVIVSFQGRDVLLTVEDCSTSSTIAVIKGSTLEESYVNLFGLFATSVRDQKTMKYTGLSWL